MKFTFKGARRMAASTLGVALMVSLAACGVGGGGGASSAAKAGNCTLSDEVSNDKPLTGTPSGEITFQTTALKQSFEPYFNDLIKAFEAKYPGTKIKWQDDPGDASFTQRLVTDAQTCQLPDVVNLNQQTAYALFRENFLLNFSKKAPDYGKEFIPSIWNSIKFHGSDDHFMLPWYWGLTGIQIYNKALFTKAGLDPAKPPTTVMEQFDQAAQIAKNSKGDFFAFTANPASRVPSDWQVMDAQIMNADQTQFTFAQDQKVVQWLTRLAELYKAGAMPKDTLSSDADVTKLYSAGTVTWGSNVLSFLRYVKDTNEKVYDTSAVAPLLDARGKAFQEGQFISVASTSKNPVTAMAFAQFMLTTDWQAKFVADERVAIFPSTPEAFKIPKFTKIDTTTPLGQATKLSVDLAQTAENTFLFNWSDAVQQAVVAELQKALAGSKSPQDALDAAQKAANDVLKRQNR
ncbi:MAG: extracellular solute-binding protein [Micropruina sp.]